MEMMDMAAILFADKTVLYLSWNQKEGWQTFGDGCPLIDRKPLQEKGIKGLCDIIADVDREFLISYIDDIYSNKTNKEGSSDGYGFSSDIPIKLKLTDGSMGFFYLKCNVVKDNSGEIEGMVARIRELYPEEVYRIRLARTITNDKNPEYFLKGANDIMDKNPDKEFALIQFDVARFKMINEQYGESVGDEMLEYFINELAVICGPLQLYARLTADVFMILTPYTGDQELDDFVKYLHDRLQGYKGINYRLVFGICKIRDRKQAIRKYGDGAAFARQSVKGDALNYIGHYQDEMKENARNTKFIEDNMENALATGQFVMYLQPKYSISKKKLIGAEALVRWVHPEKGIIPPMKFVPQLEKNGFIKKMDRYIWEEACKQIRTWMDSGITPVPISVNVSRRNLENDKFVYYLNDLVEKYNIPKHYLEIEITETIEDEHVDNGVRLLKQNGFSLLMDDFGSGYSSLNMLKDTQFDVIKIDREFLQNFIGSDRGQKIVEHTIMMAQDIGLDMIAEGVETEAQAVFLSHCGCDMAQGYYYARPMTTEKFNNLMEE